MKTIILLSILIFTTNSLIFGQTNSDKEIVILRVNHFLKSSGLVTKISIEIGDSPTHSLKGKVENGEVGSVRYNKSDGTTTVYHNEVDVISFLLNNGYKILTVYENNVGSRPFVNYILEK